MVMHDVCIMAARRMISRDTAIETDIKKKKEIEGDIAVEREIEHEQRQRHEDKLC